MATTTHDSSTDRRKRTVTRRKRTVIRRVYRFTTGVVGVCIGFLLLMVPLLALIDFPGILDDWFDVQGWQGASGMSVFLLLALLAAILLGCGALVVFIIGHRAGARTATYNGLGLGGVLTLLAMVFLTPLFLRPHEKPHRPTCTSNLRQLSLGLQMYLQDNGGRLPSHWEDAITMYTYAPLPERWQKAKNMPESIFICPNTERRFHTRGGYGMNANLAGQRDDDLQHPDSLLLLADSKKSGLLSAEQDIALRHPTGRGYCCVYLDGRAERRDASATIRWK